MFRIIFGIFLVLHGFVHLLYAGQSWRFFELKPGMVWPDGSWVFSRLLGDSLVRKIAGISLVLATFGFVAGGIGLLFGQSWAFSLVMGAGMFSAVIFLLFWDMKMERLDEKGVVGVLLDGLIVAVLIFLL